MEKTIHTLALLSAVLFSMTAVAQDYNVQIRLHDGTTKSWPTSQIAHIDFRQDAPPTYEGLTGRWMLIASPAGLADNSGIGTATIDTIRFTATLAADGGSLLCHADTLYEQGGTVYPADWQVLVMQNEQDGTRRLGWQLSEQTPATIIHNSQFIIHNSQTYLYLLSENIQTARLEGMTLWSNWQAAPATTYTFPQTQEVYALLTTSIPYAPPADYLEIWASPRFVKLP